MPRSLLPKLLNIKVTYAKATYGAVTYVLADMLPQRAKARSYSQT